MLPEGIAIGDDGLVWAATTQLDHIEAIDPEAGEVVETLDTGNEPRRIVIVDGQAWVTNTGAGTVSVIPLGLSGLTPAELLIPAIEDRGGEP